MKNYISVLILVLSISVLSGCVTFALRTTVEISNDSFSRVTTYLGIESNESEDPNGSMFASASARYFIRSFRTDNSVEHQLYVHSFYDGSNWPFFNRAITQNGEALEFTDISSDVTAFSASSMLYEEVFGLELPDKLLRDNQSGFDIKIYGKSGVELIIRVNEEMISSQLNAIDAM
jgi:hypothetical protein